MSAYFYRMHLAYLAAFTAGLFSSYVSRFLIEEDDYPDSPLYSDMWEDVVKETSSSEQKPEYRCWLDPRTVELETYAQTSASAWETIQEECADMDAQAMDACEVPNVVHFVWIWGDTFRLDHYYAVLTAASVLKPEYMFVHGLNFPIRSPYFLKAINELGLIPIWSRDVVDVFGRSVAVIEHKSDVVRLESLLRFGGMYFDFDVVISRPILDVFRKEETVLPLEANGLNNGIIIAKRCSRFLRRWFETYKSFDDTCWDCSSIRVPKELALKYPDEIRMDDQYIKSNYPESGNIVFGKVAANPSDSWDEVGAVHTFIRYYPEFKDLDEKEVFTIDVPYSRIVRNAWRSEPPTSCASETRSLLE